MPAVIIALIHLVGDLLIGVLLTAGVVGVLVAFIAPGVWAHPVAVIVGVLLIAALIKRRS